MSITDSGRRRRLSIKHPRVVRTGLRMWCILSELCQRDAVSGKLLLFVYLLNLRQHFRNKLQTLI